jgi:hypothetical protein
LAGLTEFELGIGGEKALVVGWATVGVFAACLRFVSRFLREMGQGEGIPGRKWVYVRKS